MVGMLDTPIKIETVCLVGAGTMGCFNALLAAVAGYHAVVYDVSEKSLASTPSRLEELADFLVAQNFFPESAAHQALSRIRCTTDLADAVNGAQLISESVPEQLELKREVFRELDALCSSNVLITTNTSGLLVSDIEDALEYGERFAALHSHLGSRLFDIVAGQRTSQATIDSLQEYVNSIGCKPLLLNKEHPGYVINAILGPLLATAKVLVIEGLASIEDVDRAWMTQQSAAIGPFGLMDLFGLNVIYDSWQKPNHRSPMLQRKVLDFIVPYIDNDHLGVKTGRGFYQYPAPAYASEDFLTTDGDSAFLYLAMRNAVIESAIAIAHNGVATPAAIDDAWCFTMSVGKGPFELLDDLGKERFLAGHTELRALGFGSDEQTRLVSAYLA